MRIRILCPIFFVFIVSIVACSKEKMPPVNASLSIYNAIPGSNYLLVNFDGLTLAGWFNQLLSVEYNYPYVFQNRIRSYSEQQELAIYQASDTVPGKQPLFHLTLPLPAGSIHSLFLVGIPEAPDTLFTTDTPPYYTSRDSVAGIRFINLSPGSAPISVNIKGQPNGSTMASLPYKGVTSFMGFAATYDVEQIIFEFRDAVSGTILATYAANNINNDSSDPNDPRNWWRFRNSTLALTGLPGTQNILVIRNYQEL